MPVASFSLRQQAYERIRELLRSGRWEPGAKLSTLELSRRLGISRTPIREALSKLSSDGIVREVPGFGAYVLEPSEAELVEVYGLRETLEAYAAREAAAHITEAELDHLEELVARWRAIAHHLRDSGQQRLDAKAEEHGIRIDEQFHKTLLGAARNRLLFKTVDDMRLMSRTLEARRLHSSDMTDLALISRSFRDHARLLRALRRRDPDAAEHWMRHQIRMGRNHHLRSIRNRSAEDSDLSSGSAAGQLTKPSTPHR